jgi:formiminotetrahydrofolate cyclodeaminase
MIDQSFAELVESMAAKTPTPGGGAAAALSACMGTALFLMVVRFSRGKKATLDRDSDLQAAEARLQEHLERLMPMAERDCASFDQVSKAYGLPKESDEDKAVRSRAIQEAMVGAMVVPEETMCMVRDVLQTMSAVNDCVAKSIASDLASGAHLLLAGGEGAFLNVRINAAYLENRELAESTMQRAIAVLGEVKRYQAAIAEIVEKLLA